MISHKQLLADHILILQEAITKLSDVETQTWNTIQADLNTEKLAKNQIRLTSLRRYYRSLYS
ncbi:hypothetical protein [Spirosoma foliorum]|uniref:Uncharacterized protein n=1 Tax=Spirosoma foliorum TaxID=2710596 RepID=A0A7G5H361_9BACT|nr:hypothetical protein [Spirosoma foliorum]QMW05553.1 hypothetical protein H3H32_12010 [Spirosoma foliorum]